jgi:hypothetical protein
MKRFSTLWQRITRTSRMRALEAEISRQRAELDRLRTENRALLSSILGIAGIPPLSIPQARLTVDLGAPFDAEPLSSQSHSESSTRPLADDDSAFRPPPPANHAGTNGLSALRQESERSDSTGTPLPAGQSTRPRDDSLQSAPRARPLAPPHRRRSWHQINRILEIESARKPAAGE